MSKTQKIIFIAFFVVAAVFSSNIAAGTEGAFALTETYVSYYVGEELAFSSPTPVGGAYELDEAYVPTGYEFSGWYLLDGKPFILPYTEDENLNVYARFDVKTASNHDVIYMVEGELYAERELKDGNCAEILLPERTGYDFIGWFTDSSTLIPYEGAPVVRDLTLYGKFEKKSFTVTFYGLNGRIISQQTVFYGEAAATPSENIDEKGYNFLRFEGEYQSVTKATAIFAVYAEKSLYRDENGNEIFEPPVREGFEFVGWESREANGESFFTPSYRKLYYAIDVQSNEGGRVECVTSKAFGESVEVTAVAFTGYQTEGLYYEADGVKTPITDNTFIMPSKPVTVSVSFTQYTDKIVLTIGKAVGRVTVKSVVLPVKEEVSFTVEPAEISPSELKTVAERLEKALPSRTFTASYFKLEADKKGVFETEFYLSEKPYSCQVAVYQDGKLLFFEENSSEIFKEKLPTDAVICVISYEKTVETLPEAKNNGDAIYIIVIAVLSFVLVCVFIVTAFGERMKRLFSSKRKVKNKN